MEKRRHVLKRGWLARTYDQSDVVSTRVKESQPWSHDFPSGWIWWISLLLFNEIGSLGRGVDLEKKGKWVQFCYSSALSEPSQSMSRKQVDMWVWRENKGRGLGSIYMCILGRRNAANNQNQEEAVEEDQEWVSEITRITGEVNFNKEEVVGIFRCSGIAASERLQNVPSI